MKQIKMILIGIGISSTIYLLMGLVFTSGQTRLNIMLVLLLGLISGVLSLIYDNEKLSMLMKTSIHVIGMLITFYAIALTANWFEFKLVQMLSATIIFLVFFFSIYSYFYFKEKREVEKINLKINS